MEKENILEQEITEKKKATPKKKVASSSKEETKKTTAKKTTAKKTTTKKAETEKKSTAKKGTATKKATTKKTDTEKKSATKKTVSKKAAVEKIDEIKENIVLQENNVIQENIDKQDDSVEDTIQQVKETEKKDLSQLFNKDSSTKINKVDEVSDDEETKKFDLPKRSTDGLPKSNSSLDSQEFDHVAVLKKKMEAQKKLREKINDDNQLIKPEIPSFEVDNNVIEDKSHLESENEALSSEVETLKQENEKLKSEISGLMADITDKEEKLIILTNSMVGKSTEEELAKELELLRKENKELQEEIALNKEKEDQVVEEVKEEPIEMVTFDVTDKGEISLRIRLLNERIAEKDKQIRLVEEELNSLSEKDIVAEGFTSEIKRIRKIRKESIAQANMELNEIAKLVKSSESKLLAKKNSYEAKCEELDLFEKNLKTKTLNYLEKEAELVNRSKIYAEKDSLFIEIESYEENYKKLLNRYKTRLEQAEKRLESLNNSENELINKYLEQLRKDKSDSNEDYQVQIIERKALCQELEKLTKEMEVPVEPEKLSFEQFDLDGLKADLAKANGKIIQINSVYSEREKIERVLLKNEPIIKEYYDSFKNREIIMFNINENNLRVKALEEKELLEQDLVKKEAIKAKISTINIMIEDDKSKANYYNNIIEKSRNDEKVVFYIKLINSMTELKEKEQELLNKINNLKSNIEKLEEIN